MVILPSLPIAHTRDPKKHMFFLSPLQLVRINLMILASYCATVYDLHWIVSMSLLYLYFQWFVEWDGTGLVENWGAKVGKNESNAYKFG